jgi:Fe-S oxidoreductase
LYDYGLLDTARKWLQNILHSLQTEIRAGTPVIGLEPSCISVFREEMPDLLHGDEDADRLRRQSFVLSEFLEQNKYTPPHIGRSALIHGHCHHKSTLDWNSELNLLRKAGLDLRTPETGCCGMAGAFGYESDHYDVSMACAERVLLPAIRETNSNDFVLADGFSCREQIRQTSDRRALHFAQLLQLGIRGSDAIPSDIRPLERALTRESETAGVPIGLILGVGLLGGAAYAWSRKRRH